MWKWLNLFVEEAKSFFLPTRYQHGGLSMYIMGHNLGSWDMFCTWCLELHCTGILTKAGTVIWSSCMKMS